MVDVIIMAAQLRERLRLDIFSESYCLVVILELYITYM